MGHLTVVRVQALLIAVAAFAALSCGAPTPEVSTDATRTSSQGETNTADPALTVQTVAGTVRGMQEGGVAAFKGIPYGADTGGANRFKSPRAMPPWTGIRDAVAYGPICPQVGVVAGGSARDYWLGYTQKLPSSEDCLVLNLWTPALPAELPRASPSAIPPGNPDGAIAPLHEPRAVMVWLHGRGYAEGAGSEPVYNGSDLARDRDVVVVTLNHRLNLFGFLDLSAAVNEELASSGVAGLLDVVLALRWLQDNVANFGGDPKRVTIFGESGGAAKVSMLLAMPVARGLFHRAIIQSGATLRAVETETAQQTAATLMKSLNVAPNDVDSLRAMPPERLLSAAQDAALLSDFAPSLSDRYLPAHPFDPSAAPPAFGVPLLIGTNRDGAMPLATSERPMMSEAELRTALSRTLGRHVEAILATYRAERPDASPSALYVAISSDRARMAAIALAERQLANGAAVYVYELTYETDYGGGMKAAGGLDVPFVFNHPNIAPLSGSGADRVDLARIMSSTWAAFAQHGDPNNAHIPEWPRYDVTRRATLLVSVPANVINDPRSAERAAWQGVPMR